MFRSITIGLLDFCIVILCAYLAHWIRFDNFFRDPYYDSLIPVGALLFSISAIPLGLYNGTTKSMESLVRTLATCFIAFSLLFIYLVFSKTSETYSRLWLGYWIASSSFGVLCIRFLFQGLRRWWHSNPKNRKRVLLIGDSNIAWSIINDEKNLNLRGLTVSGFVRTTGEPNQNIDRLLDVNSDKLEDQVKDSAIEEVWICLPLSQESEVKRIQYELRHTTTNIRQILKTQDLNVLAKPISDFYGISTLDISCSPHRGSKLFLKNLEDYTLGLILFVTMIPLLLVIAVAVKFSSPGPILFKQHRHGVDGRKFKVYKFRTMKLHQEEGGVVTQAVKDDPRVTSVGRFLRRTSLDELPQFFNVLQGRMSIVGPRPHALEHNTYYSELIDSYMRRHMVKPGITGWAQVNGFRGETETLDKMQKRVEYDMYYIENWTVWLDLKTLLLTPYALLRRDRAY